MTKTYAPDKRSAESAKRHLERSLERLQTDVLDLWQLHNIRSVEDVDRSFREGAAMQYILEMKQKGVVRHVGVTEHVRPAAHRRALALWDEGWEFDAMQIPINPIDFHQLSFQREVLPELTRRNIAVLAMTTSASRNLLKKKVCIIEECLRYVLSLPVSISIVGLETPEHVRRNARVARENKTLTAAHVEGLLERIRPQAVLDLESYKG